MTISSKILKFCKNELAGSLTDIFNKSFQQGQFETALNISKINPKDKGGRQMETSNYTANSLIPTFANYATVFLAKIVKH